jgi:hypothetical protein
MMKRFLVILVVRDFFPFFFSGVASLIVGVQSFECFPQHMPCYVSHVVGLQIRNLIIHWINCASCIVFLRDNLPHRCSLFFDLIVIGRADYTIDILST